MLPTTWKIYPGVYALVGATSVLGGVFRASISLVVIMVEGTRGIEYIFGVIVAIAVSNWVADVRNSSVEAFDICVIISYRQAAAFEAVLHSVCLSLIAHSSPWSLRKRAGAGRQHSFSATGATSTVSPLQFWPPFVFVYLEPITGCKLLVNGQATSQASARDHGLPCHWPQACGECQRNMSGMALWSCTGRR